MSGIDKGWSTYLLRSSYVNARKLVAYLDDLKISYQLSTQRGFYIISTPQPLSLDQKANIQKASEIKLTSQTKTLQIPTRLSQKRRSHSPILRTPAPDRKEPQTYNKGSLSAPTRSATTKTSSSSSKWYNAFEKLGFKKPPIVDLVKMQPSNEMTLPVDPDSAKALNNPT